MKMQTKKFVYPVLLFAAVIAVAAVYADTTDDAPTTTPWGCYGHTGDGDFVPQGWTGLTDEQIEALKEKHTELRESDLTRDEMHEEMQKIHEELGITGPNFVDVDGDGICDNHASGTGGPGYGRGGCGMGSGRGGGYGMGQGTGFGHMGW